MGDQIIINPAHDERTKTELHAISSEERELVWSDMTANSETSFYGNSSDNIQFNPTQDEPSEFVTQRILQLDEELGRLIHQYGGGHSDGDSTTTANKSSKGGGKASAYMHVLRTHPEYVNNRRFKLMFLRADRFHTHAAAKRIIDHFNFKQDK